MNSNFQFARPCHQRVEARAEQGLEQRLPRPEVAIQRAEPNASLAGDITQRCVGALLGHDPPRDREQVVVVLPGVGSHVPQLTNGATGRFLRTLKCGGALFLVFLGFSDAEEAAKLGVKVAMTQVRSNGPQLAELGRLLDDGTAALCRARAGHTLGTRGA